MPAKQGLVTLHAGSGPVAYVVHGIDGDVFGVGASYLSLAPLLAPCSTSALHYDEEAYECNSIPALAAVYNRRVVAHMASSPSSKRKRLIIGGYSFGCVIAHQMALQFEAAGVDVILVLIDFEVTWPPRGTGNRVGAYDWMGGDIEAILLFTRGLNPQWSLQKLNEWNGTPCFTQPQIQELKEEAFAASLQGKIAKDSWDKMLQLASRNMDRLNLISQDWAPKSVFSGHTIFVMAPSSPEFADSARAVNSKYCKNIHAEYALGTHYNILQKENAHAAADVVMRFLKFKQLVPNSGITVLHEGTAPNLYFVQDWDGIGEWSPELSQFAKLLDPCRVCLLDVDLDATSCHDIPALARVYNQRIIADIKQHRRMTSNMKCPSTEIECFVTGYSFGALVAHQMALQLESAGVKVALMLVSGGVLYDPMKSCGWLGVKVEASMLMARRLGLHQAVSKQVEKLAAYPEEQRSTEELEQQVFAELPSLEPLWLRVMHRVCTNIESLRSMTKGSSIMGTFGGNVLLVLPSEVMGKAELQQQIEERCKSVSVEVVTGNYDRIYIDNAWRLADTFRNFLHCCHAFSIPGQVHGVLTMQAGAGPRVYLVHGIDGDALGQGSSFVSLAPLLGPCHVSALAFDDQAFHCDTMHALASLYNRRILGDLRNHSQSPDGQGQKNKQITIAGYSFGCVIAHEMAVQFQEVGAQVGLVLLDFEVMWPPVSSEKRVGGYRWLGGEIEASLLISRACGAHQWANQKVCELLHAESPATSANTLRKQAMEALSEKIEPNTFLNWTSKAAKKMDKLAQLGRNQKSKLSFGGYTLLLLAQDSEEFAGAAETNRLYCTSMTIEHCQGNHYNMLQAGNVQDAAKHIFQFLSQHGELNSLPDTADIPGVLTQCQGDGPRIYMVHGIDGDAFTPGACSASLAPLLNPCHVCALVFDDEAVKCKSLHALATVYNKRILADVKHSRTAKSKGKKQSIIIGGYSFGAVIAYHMVCQFQKVGVLVGLLVFDHAVLWPSSTEATQGMMLEWLGGKVEACILMARALGSLSFAEREAQIARKSPPEERAVDMLTNRLYHSAASACGMALTDLQTFVHKAGVNMDALNAIARGCRPNESFTGSCLVLLAHESAESHCIREINSKFCLQMQVEYVLGTHFNMLDGSNAPAAAKSILKFIYKLGEVTDTQPTQLVVQGLSTLQVGDLTRVYMVHGIDGDTGLSTSSTLVSELAPYNVCALLYDDEAFRQDSLPSLAALYNKRIQEDVEQWRQQNGGGHGHQVHVIICGYSFGCVIAHQMALQFQELPAFQSSTIRVSLVLLDSEVVWPPAANLCRMGGYKWLGGEIEATLLVARRSGAVEFAEQMVHSILASSPECCDKNRLQMQVYCKFVSKLGMSREEFKSYVTSSSVLMDKLDVLARSFEPATKFLGSSLLLLAPSSSGFDAAQQVNSEYCAKLHVEQSCGTHYSMLNDGNSSAIADAIVRYIQISE